MGTIASCASERTFCSDCTSARSIRAKQRGAAACYFAESTSIRHLRCKAWTDPQFRVERTVLIGVHTVAEAGGTATADAVDSTPRDVFKLQAWFVVNAYKERAERIQGSMYGSHAAPGVFAPITPGRGATLPPPEGAGSSDDEAERYAAEGEREKARVEEIRTDQARNPLLVPYAATRLSPARAVTALVVPDTPRDIMVVTASSRVRPSADGGGHRLTVWTVTRKPSDVVEVSSCETAAAATCAEASGRAIAIGHADGAVTLWYFTPDPGAEEATLGTAAAGGSAAEGGDSTDDEAGDGSAADDGGSDDGALRSPHLARRRRLSLDSPVTAVCLAPHRMRADALSLVAGTADATVAGWSLSGGAEMHATPLFRLSARAPRFGGLVSVSAISCATPPATALRISRGAAEDPDAAAASRKPAQSPRSPRGSRGAIPGHRVADGLGSVRDAASGRPREPSEESAGSARERSTATLRLAPPPGARSADSLPVVEEAAATDVVVAPDADWGAVPAAVFVAGVPAAAAGVASKGGKAPGEDPAHVAVLQRRGDTLGVTQTLSVPGGGVGAVAFGPYNNGPLATGARDGSIRVWDYRSGTCLRELAGHTGAVAAIVVDSGNALWSGGAEGAVMGWKV